MWFSEIGTTLKKEHFKVKLQLIQVCQSYFFPHKSNLTQLNAQPLSVSHVLLLISWVEHSLNLPISLVSVQPLSTLEDGCDRVGCVGHLNALQVPPAACAAVVVLHLDPQELPKVQHLQDKAVRLAPFKEVAELLAQVTLARVTVDAVDGEENVGICAGRFDVPSDDDDFILDRNQATDFAGETLNGLVALKCQELVLFGCQGDFCITVEEIPEQGGGKVLESHPRTFILFFGTQCSTTHLFPSSFSVTTTSMTCQKASLLTFLPSFVMCPRQMPAISPTCLDENSNMSVAPLSKDESFNLLDPVQRTVKFTGVPESFSFSCASWD